MNRFLSISLILLLFTTSLLPTSALATTHLSTYSVCLDPGHGGSDPGAIYNDGNDGTIYLEEATINLDVAFKVKGYLEGDGATVYMTREDDVYLTNEDRYTICNSTRATILVSIHTNSSTNTGIDGTMTLYFHEDDRVLAQAIHEKLYPILRDDTRRTWSFTDFGLERFASGVLLKSNMPAAMMEPVLMSHPEEAALLVADDADVPGSRRDLIAQGIVFGIENYFANYYNSGGGGGGGRPCAQPPCGKGK